MKRFYTAAAVTTVARLAPGLAAAQSFNYAAVQGGWTQVRDTHFDIADPQDRADHDARVDQNYGNGYNFAAAFGRQYDQGRDFNTRAEVELGYQEGNVDRHRLRVTDNSGVVPQQVENTRFDRSGGHTEIVTLFASVYGERALRNIDNMNFIFGAGAGVGHVYFNGYSADGSVLLHDSDVSYAFHLTTGWSYELTDRIALEATYRYMSIEDLSFKAGDGTSTSDQRVDSHSFQAGVRYGF